MTNEPHDVIASVPVWIRPDEAVLTLTSLDASMYGCDANYTLQTGGDGRFYVDAASGEVRIRDRAEFLLTQSFTLGVSAECAGAAAALNRETHSQRVTILVEDVDPQFYYDPYVIGVPETSNRNTMCVHSLLTTNLDFTFSFQLHFLSSVDRVKVKSFQELPLTYNVVWDEPAVDTQYFSIDSSTGDLRLLQDLVYIEEDKLQFRCMVTVTEADSGYSTEREVGLLKH